LPADHSLQIGSEFDGAGHFISRSGATTLEEGAGSFGRNSSFSAGLWALSRRGRWRGGGPDADGSSILRPAPGTSRNDQATERQQIPQRGIVSEHTANYRDGRGDKERGLKARLWNGQGKEAGAPVCIRRILDSHSITKPCMFWEGAEGDDALLFWHQRN
jgi:hypothetical protein